VARIQNVTASPVDVRAIVSAASSVVIGVITS
jgi:hypothetical protein